MQDIKVENYTGSSAASSDAKKEKIKEKITHFKNSKTKAEHEIKLLKNRVTKNIQEKKNSDKELININDREMFIEHYKEEIKKLEKELNSIR